MEKKNNLGGERGKEAVGRQVRLARDVLEWRGVLFHLALGLGSGQRGFGGGGKGGVTSSRGRERAPGPTVRIFLTAGKRKKIKV